MKIDHGSNIPIYEQIYQQFLNYITTGLMPSDSQLPSIRELSSSLHVNPNTVFKAYRLLEEQGFIYSIPGKGSFVSSKQLTQTELFKNQINQLTKEVVVKSKYIGLSFEEVCQLLEQMWEEK